MSNAAVCVVAKAYPHMPPSLQGSRPSFWGDRSPSLNGIGVRAFQAIALGVEERQVARIGDDLRYPDMFKLPAYDPGGCPL